ncbi:hypothetical protein BO94DRAFT_397388 [Aspergillus sclerotioniger CBS 115572]|uniref:Uncharacterized protein n=1 Tax=Aspergillus sclerotioniger CBS 115572 TaxID=1450535 RepID=A0A317WYV2_9EURO|nr:hypothetical protein BO94DRAFT_397388 [Aspergillus sclerotioniger CBS 115572]PWY91574.1 hypothetical protein BO94DRAFT_397388 [Aspergillus sclerotioniger CBS 115572]
MPKEKNHPHDKSPIGVPHRRDCQGGDFLQRIGSHQNKPHMRDIIVSVGHCYYYYLVLLCLCLSGSSHSLPCTWDSRAAIGFTSSASSGRPSPSIRSDCCRTGLISEVLARPVNCQGC